MAADNVKTESTPESKKSLPILYATAQAWECPVCKRGNGIPEVSKCRCGATLNGDGTVTPKP